MLKQHRELSMFADARSRAACEYFGDVVLFDTTYNTNRYNLVFSSFVGVNHHGKVPKGILTDQYASMQRAIEMSHVVWNSFTKDAFDRNWNDFITKGILCRHSLSILSFERVDNVAPKYILERWSKNIKRRHTHIKSSQDEPLLEPKSKRFDDLVFQSYNIYEFASKSEELTRIMDRAFDNIMAEMQEYQARSKGKSLLFHE
ncbi:hypothetical protein Ahy_B05g076481 [Arachis hypogaea]|uniref:Protein FAR1-RELATED SEQUENCE n=1 Tax=Arachis hypogaea TaxID=3818 RepID=A0A444Z3B0_ARAHY|nr:hypothetical protein Ahy_B05g076481 [Arachis hypogaea]